MSQIENTSSGSRTLKLTLAIVLNLIWALSYPLSKDIMQEISPLGLTFLRLLGGVLVLLPLLKRKDIPQKITRKDFVLLVSMGVVGCGLSTAFQFWATRMTLASNVSLLVALETLSVVILSAIFLKERITRLAFFGLVVAFAGVLLITVDPSSLQLFSKDFFWGNVLMIVSVVCYALYTLIGKKLSTNWGPSALTVLPFLAALVFLFPALVMFDSGVFGQIQNLSVKSWLYTGVIAGIGTGFGFLVWNWLLKSMSASTLSKSLYIQPVAGIFFSYWLLNEPITIISLCGGALVLVGIALGERTSEKSA